eukprot:IDg11995t1
MKEQRVVCATAKHTPPNGRIVVFEGVSEGRARRIVDVGVFRSRRITQGVIFESMNSLHYNTQGD